MIIVIIIGVIVTSMHSESASIEYIIIVLISSYISAFMLVTTPSIF